MRHIKFLKDNDLKKYGKHNISIKVVDNDPILIIGDIELILSRRQAIFLYNKLK